MRGPNNVKIHCSAVLYAVGLRACNAPACRVLLVLQVWQCQKKPHRRVTGSPSDLSMSCGPGACFSSMLRL